MKKSNPFFNFIKQLNPNNETKTMKFKSMKEFFHNPNQYIKSENLSNCFSPVNKANSTRKEYSVIFNQKEQNSKKKEKQNKYMFSSPIKLKNIKKISKINMKNVKIPESSESSFNNYNYKVGLNAPLSYNDKSYSNSSLENIEKSKKNLKKNNNMNTKCNNILNEIHDKIQKNKNGYKGKKNFDYSIFINANPKNLDDNNSMKKNPCKSKSKKLKSNVSDNKIIKGIFYKKIHNNYSSIYRERMSNSKQNEIIFNEYIKEQNYINSNQPKKSSKSKNNKNNVAVKILVNENSNKKDNLGIFEKILIDLKYVKSAINKNNKHIIYNIENSKNYFKINNDNIKPKTTAYTPNELYNRNKNIFPKVNESKLSSSSFSHELNDINSSRSTINNIKVKNTYNLVKNCTDKKNYLKSVPTKKEKIDKKRLSDNSNNISNNKNYSNNNNISSNNNASNTTTNNNKIEQKPSELNSYKNSSKSKNTNNNNSKRNNIENEEENEEKEGEEEEDDDDDDDDDEEKEEKEESEEKEENQKIIDEKNNEVENNIKPKPPENNDNNNYIKKIFETRKAVMKQIKSNLHKSPGVNLYNRGQLYKANTDLKTANLRRKLKEKEFLEITNTPKINENSKRISKNNLPIYERLDEIEIKKQSDLQRLKNLIIKENDIDETTINQKCEKNFDKNNFDKWLSKNDKWNKQKNSKMEKIKDMLNQQKLNDENFQFKPTINKNSEKIFNKNEKLAKSPVVERLLKKNEKKELFLKKENDKKKFMFIPSINKEYPISDKYYNFMDEDQAELYNELKEKVDKAEYNKFSQYDKYFKQFH